MINKIKQFLFKRKLKGIQNKIEYFNKIHEALKVQRVLITNAQIKKTKRKFKRTFKTVSDKTFIEKLKDSKVIELIEIIDYFIEKLDSLTTYSENLNKILEEQKQKSDQFIYQINEFKKDPEQDEKLGRILEEYKDVYNYLDIETKKLLPVFTDFKDYYTNIDTYQTLWINIKRHFKKIVEFNDTISDQQEPNYYFIKDIQKRYGQASHFFKDKKTLKEVVWDKDVISTFRKYYKNIDQHIKGKNHNYFDVN
ncbi:hypothetical protein [Haloplasma contractile]|uniref:Uncharacterized protein n=1 Tax=Haloplasma contractile SSD-17B TaxID=1033810 RepID=F7Q1R6_9MOLU|nr:hypothetical protein [Haloplasma contractile]ERJ12271.1 hypothetical protein HLPCO_001798 [Haloplasma contractile SSD-17B]